MLASYTSGWVAGVRVLLQNDIFLSLNLMKTLLCLKPGCYHSDSKTHVRDKMFELNLIHASVIISFPEFAEFSEMYALFRKNSIVTIG